MELSRNAFLPIGLGKPLPKPMFYGTINGIRSMPGGKYCIGVLAAASTYRSGSSGGKNGKPEHSSRNRGSGETAVIELPEVTYHFTDAGGNSATFIGEDGTVSRISIIEEPSLVKPLASFIERDIDPASSEPVVPISILAPSPLLPAVMKSVDGGINGSSVDTATTQFRNINATIDGYGKCTSMIITTSVNGGAAVFTYVTRSHDPATGAVIPAANPSGGTALAGSSSSSNTNRNTEGGFPDGGDAVPVVVAASPTRIVDFFPVNRTIKVERDEPHPIQQMINRMVRWRPHYLVRWLKRVRRRTLKAKARKGDLPRLLLPGPRTAPDGAATVHHRSSAVEGTAAAAATHAAAANEANADADIRAAAVDADVVSDSITTDSVTDFEDSSFTESIDVEASVDGDDSDMLWDPALLGTLVLSVTAASVAVLMAMASASTATAAAAAAAAAVLAAPPTPSPVDWVQLNPVPGMAPEAAAVQWHLLTWREICNQVLEPVSRAIQKWSYAALPVKIAFVLISSLPLVVVFGALYYVAVGGRSAGQSFVEALVKIHCILNRMPGTNMVKENNMVSFLVVNLAFFTGLFTFAIFLGIVSDEVKNTFRSIKTGDYPVRVRDHVLVINWSHHTIPLLRQYDLARQYAGNDAFFRRPVVLLSDNPKQDMDNEIAERLKSSSLDVITRSGSPAMVRDLKTVAAASAHTVIVLHPGGAASHASAEAAKASTAMALAALTVSEASEAAASNAKTGGRGGADRNGEGIWVTARDQVFSSLGLAPKPTHGSASRRLPRVLFQMPDEVLAAQDPVTSFTKSSPANISGNMQALSITDASVIDRFTCQAAVQPGMLRIWASVLQHGPHSIKALMVPVPPLLVGSTFGTARCQYSDAVLIGVMRANCNATCHNGNGNPSTAPATSSSSTSTGAGGYSLHMDLRELDSWELAVGDMLVMFVPARVAGMPQANPATATLFPPAAAAAAERIKRHGGYNAPPKKVIAAGYCWPDVQDVAAAFSDSAPDGSQLTFILASLPSPDAGEPELPGSSGACRIRYVDTKGPMLSLRALQEAGIKTADAVILRPPIQDMERWCAKKPVTARIREADAMVMAGLIQVQDAVIASGRTDPPHVVARLNRYGSTETALRYFEMLSPTPQPQQPLLPHQQQQQPHPSAKQQQQQQQQPQQQQQQQSQQLQHVQHQQQQQQTQGLKEASLVPILPQPLHHQQHVKDQQAVQLESHVGVSYNQHHPANPDHHHHRHLHNLRWLGFLTSFYGQAHPEVTTSPPGSAPPLQPTQPSQQQVPTPSTLQHRRGSSKYFLTSAANASPLVLQQQQQQDQLSQQQEQPHHYYHHHHHHHHLPWWQVWRGILPFTRRTAIVAGAPTAVAMAALSPGADLSSLHDVSEYLYQHQHGHKWPLRWHSLIRHSQGYDATPATRSALWAAKWNEAAAAGSAMGTAIGQAPVAVAVAAAHHPLQPQQLQPKHHQKDAKDAAQQSKEQHSKEQQQQQAPAADVSMPPGGTTVAAGVVAQPVNHQVPAIGNGQGHGHGQGLNLSLHLPILNLPGTGGGSSSNNSAPAATAASEQTSNAAPASPYSGQLHSASSASAGSGSGGGGATTAATGPAGGSTPAAAAEGGATAKAATTAAAATAAAVASSPLSQTSLGHSVSAGDHAGSPQTGIVSVGLVAPGAPHQASAAVAAVAVASAGQAPLQSLVQPDGPLAATQAVMMGTSSALPIGNEGSVGGTPRSPVPGAIGGGGGGATATAPLLARGLAESGVGGGGAGNSGASGGAGGSATAPVVTNQSSGSGVGSYNISASGSGGSTSSTNSTSGSSSSTSSNNGIINGSNSGSHTGSNGGTSTSGGAAPAAGAAGSSQSGPSISSSNNSGSTTGGAPGSSGAAGATASVYDKRPIIRNPEIFLADDLIGALLTQVAAQPSYTQLVSELISKEGAELYLRNPAVFNIFPGELLSFAELSETTRLLRQVALGVVRADGHCCLVPKPHELLDFEPGDQVLVLSDDYRIRRK